ncbi:hypothetical protein [Marinactinospora thermotolerans]|nr:hypothetical protein [Marinactinospora thermotolerans]
MSKHDDPSRWDGQKDKPIPPPTPDGGGSSGGKHERDENDK